MVTGDTVTDTTFTTNLIADIITTTSTTNVPVGFNGYAVTLEPLIYRGSEEEEEEVTPPPTTPDHRIANKIILEDRLVALREGTDFDSLKKIKLMLDSHFGKDNNQILLLTEDRIEELAYRMLNVSIRNAIWNYPSYDFLKIINRMMVYEVIIHFPEITITNSENVSRKILDLYVSFFINPNCTYFSPGNMYGLRTTFDSEEFFCGYVHSHLHSRSIGSSIRFSRFCLGDGPIIQSMTALSKSFSEVEFKFLCLHLGNYVTWESLEGAPHFSMKYIGNREIGTILTELEERIISSYRKRIVLTIINKPTEEVKKLLRLKITARKIEVIATDKLEEEITKIILSVESSQNYKVLCFKDAQGVYHSIPVQENLLSNNKENPQAILTFKEEVRYLKIIGASEQTKKVKYAHPTITREVCKRLGHLFTNEFIEAEGITFDKDSGGDFRQATEADI